MSQLKEKLVKDGRTDGRTDGQTDSTHFKNMAFTATKLNDIYCVIDVMIC